MATNTYDQFPTTSNNNNSSGMSSQRTSTINSLLNPVPDEQQTYSVSSSSYSTQSNVDWYEDQSLENQEGQNWRRYSSSNLTSESSSSTSNNTNNKNGLTINNYREDISSLQKSSQIGSSASQSTPTSPVSKHSSPMSDYNGTNPIDDKTSSSSAPSSRRSSMNRSSGSGQAINSNGNSNMMTPPQTPGIKSPTKTNFSFPPSVTTCEQIMPQKVKRKRITQEQLQDLVAMFEQTDTPSYDVREKLAKKLNMTNREVQVKVNSRYIIYYYYYYPFILIYISFYVVNRSGFKIDAQKQIGQKRMNIAHPINTIDSYIIIQYQRHRLPADTLHQLT